MTIQDRLRSPRYWICIKADGHKNDHTAPAEAADVIDKLVEALGPFAKCGKQGFGLATLEEYKKAVAVLAEVKGGEV